MGFGGRKQPTLAVSTLEGVLKYIESKKPAAAPAPDCSRRGWRLQLDYYACTGKKTTALAMVSPSLYHVLAAYVSGEPVMYKGTVYKGDDPRTLAFCDPAHLYSLPPHEPVKSKEIRWKRVYIVGDDGWLKNCEPQPVAASTRNNSNYIGTLVVRDYYEDGVLVEQGTQFLPKF